MQTKDITQLIEDLFQTRRKANGQPYSNVEVASWVSENIPGAELSPSYVSKLRLGEARNPSRDVLMYFCVMFKVPASYFFPELSVMDTTDRIDNTTLLRMALHAQGLDEETQRHIEGLIRKLRTDQIQPKGRAQKPRSGANQD